MKGLLSGRQYPGAPPSPVTTTWILGATAQDIPVKMGRYLESVESVAQFGMVFNYDRPADMVFNFNRSNI